MKQTVIAFSWKTIILGNSYSLVFRSDLVKYYIKMNVMYIKCTIMVQLRVICT
uniref:Uncharacterized protein n=1 Tax=Anguilla anguilla TaxID=7936 RepID=A0A0E9TW45_ANGAN